MSPVLLIMALILGGWAFHEVRSRKEELSAAIGAFFAVVILFYGVFGELLGVDGELEPPGKEPSAVQTVAPGPQESPQAVAPPADQACRSEVNETQVRWECPLPPRR